MLDILPALSPEAAADIAGDDADAGLRNFEHIPRQHVAHAMRILHIGMQREALVVRVVSSERAARLHVLRMDAGDDVFALDDMRRRGESRIGRRFVAGLEDMADVVGVLLPDARRARLHRVLGINHRRQFLIIDLDQHGGVLRCGERLRDDHRHRIADIAHFAAREARMRPREGRRAVGAFPRQGEPRRAELFRRDIRLRENSEHAGRGLRGARVDGRDFRMRMRRAQEVSIRLPRQADVVDVATRAPQKPRILEAADRLTDSVFLVFHEPHYEDWRRRLKSLPAPSNSRIGA
jgi:hypothetical protein